MRSKQHFLGAGEPGGDALRTYGECDGYPGYGGDEGELPIASRIIVDGCIVTVDVVPSRTSANKLKKY